MKFLYYVLPILLVLGVSYAFFFNAKSIDISDLSKSFYDYSAISIDGDTKRTSINSFVENEFLSRDSMAFRTYVNELMPDVDMTSTYTDVDGEEKEFLVPMTIQFLWPASNL